MSAQTPFGTNLKFKLAGRKPITSDSIVSKEDASKGIVKFLPSGCKSRRMRIVQREIVVYDVPIPVREAGKIEGLILEFKHGKVVKYSAKNRN